MKAESGIGVVNKPEWVLQAKVREEAIPGAERVLAQGTASARWITADAGGVVRLSSFSRATR